MTIIFITQEICDKISNILKRDFDITVKITRIDHGINIDESTLRNSAELEVVANYIIIHLRNTYR